MFKDVEGGFEIFLASFVVVDFVELFEDPSHGVHDF